MKKIVFLSSLILLIICFSCVKNEFAINSDRKIIISNELYKNAPNDPLIITEAEIIGDSLEISFGASCCDGNSWEIKLVGSEDILYSDPPQRYVRLSLKNNELCTAVCGKSMIFDIKPSRIDGGEIVLRLEGWEEPLAYKY
jgi:hypothetical protein